MYRNIDAFIDALADAEPERAFNPWSESSRRDLLPEAHLARQERLRQHLVCSHPEFIVIGDAGGVNDVMCTGIPMSCEYTLINHLIPRVAAPLRLTSSGRPVRDEVSVGCWRVMDFLDKSHSVFFWNLFPWVPCESMDEDGNVKIRSTDAADYSRGDLWLQVLLEWHPTARLVAIGNKVQRHLAQRDIPHEAFRTPGRTGFREFEEQMSNLVLGLNQPQAAQAAVA